MTISNELLEEYRRRAEDGLSFDCKQMTKVLDALEAASNPVRLHSSGYVPRAAPATPATYAIDYDETWTTDPAAFEALARLLRGRGHRVLLVTARATGHADVRMACSEHVDLVIFTPGTPKRLICKSLGEAVDVWIDDKPEMVDRRR